ncbi:hypothetical protein ACL6C3_14700 [Capilliphycus salinus ALCB114379]|uniref:hypothetical protein n=1 Tax=Capilliphycus salinus TaxID=2768948 RepID=UPI0039A42D5B
MPNWGTGLAIAERGNQLSGRLQNWGSIPHVSTKILWRLSGTDSDSVLKTPAV